MSSITSCRGDIFDCKEEYITKMYENGQSELIPFLQKHEVSLVKEERSVIYRIFESLKMSCCCLFHLGKRYKKLQYLGLIQSNWSAFHQREECKRAFFYTLSNYLKPSESNRDKIEALWQKCSLKKHRLDKPLKILAVISCNDSSSIRSLAHIYVKNEKTWVGVCEIFEGMFGEDFVKS